MTRRRRLNVMMVAHGEGRRCGLDGGEGGGSVTVKRANTGRNACAQSLGCTPVLK